MILVTVKSNLYVLMKRIKMFDVSVVYRISQNV